MLAVSAAQTTAFLSPLTTPLDRLRALRQYVRTEAEAILACTAQLSTAAVQAAEITAGCQGCVLVTGVGKAGLVGQKLVATLASTGNPAHFLHPSEAVHGDLGRVRSVDVVWALSNSGRSEEVVRIAPHLREYASALIAITASDDNPLASSADLVVTLGKHAEACPNGLAPTCSTAVMMAVGDGIALLASQLRGFTSQDFARFHPGGALGRKLATAQQVMRPLEQCRVASVDTTIRDAMVTASKAGRRTGAIMLVDRSGRLTGLFTDSDLARILERRDEHSLDEPISTRMTRSPITVRANSSLQEALAILSHRRISELPVIDDEHCPIGLIDITDLVALTDQPDEQPTIPFPKP